MATSVKETIDRQRTYFYTHAIKDVEFRIDKLQKLKSTIRRSSPENGRNCTSFRPEYYKIVGSSR
jgi:hypothetical protein